MTTGTLIKLTWSDVWHHLDPNTDLNIYDSDGTAWKFGSGIPGRGGPWRNGLHRWDGDELERWTPDDDEHVWIDPPAVPEPPDGTRIEFEYGTDVYAAWRDDKSSADAGYAVGDGGEVWCLYGSAHPRSWAIMWLDFGDSLSTMVRLTPVPEDVPNYNRWLTAQMARGEVGADR